MWPSQRRAVNLAARLSGLPLSERMAAALQVNEELRKTRKGRDVVNQANQRKDA